MKLQIKWPAHNTLFHRFVSGALIVCALALIGCSRSKVTKVVLWTNSKEFARYVELFNASHTDVKVLIYYYANPANTLASPQDEPAPDIVVGPWLRTEKTARYFRPIDTIFDRRSFAASSFYPQLLDAGKVNHSQYLLPVSFNLPAVIFSTANQELVDDSYMISLDQLKKTGAAFNKEKPDGLSYSRIGF